MPSVTDIQVLISLLVVAAFVLPFYKAYQDRQKTKREDEAAERKEKKDQADQLHQRINKEAEERHKNECRICTLEGIAKGYKEGKAEIRAQLKQED